MRQFRHRLKMAARVVLVMAACIFCLSDPAQAGENKIGVGVGSAVCSFFYTPAKLIYASSGVVVAGLAYAVTGGDGEVAKPILNAAARGDYVVTPSHLRREESLEFIGRSPEQSDVDLDSFDDF